MRVGSLRPRITAAVALLFALAALCAAPAAVAAAELDRATAAVFPIVAENQRIGSGVLVAPDLVLTAAHVVRATDSEYVLHNGRLVPIEVVAVDDTRDLALVRARVGKGVQPIEWGDSDALARGQDVVVLGYALGMSEVSLTKGVVSSPRQVYEGSAFIQTDADINPGNSGGALVDQEGRLVGINVAKIAGIDVGGIGFAVPAADALAFVQPYAPVSATRQPVSRSPWWWAAFALGVGGASSAAAVLILRKRHSSAEEGTDLDLADDDHPPAPLPPATDRRRFRVNGPGTGATLDLRLPAVAGTARNADIRLGEDGVAEYQVRFMPGPGRGVTALSLVGDGGMYCGDACVLEAVLQPGESVRVGETLVTLLGDEAEGA